MRAAVAAVSLLATACASMRYADLPDAPKRPHDFAAQPRKYVKVKLPGREEPVGISYIEAGAGQPLLLVHGLMTSAYSWRYVISALAKKYRVLVPDLPGAGQSDAPADLSMSPISMAMVLASFEQAVGAERAYVVGNSLGGYLSTWLALLYPDRVERLLIMHAPGFPELRLSAMKFLLGAPGGRWAFSRITADNEQFVVDNVHYRDRELYSKEEVREYAAIFKDPARTDIFVRVLRESMDPAAMEQFGATLAARRDAGKPWVPVRLLWSTEDALVPPENGPRYQALIPSAELVWVERSSHFLQVDSPERSVEEILRFGAEHE
jgi:pimeloyl-ACP methyl ester carboxylesterase